MITDALLRLSNAEGPFTATTVLDKTVDLSVATDIGQGREFYVIFTVNTAFVGASPNKVSFEVVTGTDEAITAGVEVLISSPQYVAETVVKGTQIVLKVPPILGGKHPRFLGARVVEDGTISGGAVTTDIVLDIQDGKTFYKSGFEA
jgi:hypothetical protein